MRSVQVYRALDQIPNRFTLCQTISQSARRIHVNGNTFDLTVRGVLDAIGNGLFHGQTATCSPSDESNAVSETAPVAA